MKIAKIISFLICLIFSSYTFAACKWVWVDHDYNLSTPALQKQVCDSTLDVPAIKTPSVRPIQQPQIKPIETPNLPPVGTKTCITQSVYENGRWVNKKVCR